MVAQDNESRLCLGTEEKAAPPLPPCLPLLRMVHIPSGPNLSPLSSRTPQPQITQAWQPTLSQPVITHKSLYALKENFYAVLTASCAPAFAASPVLSWALHPMADALPQPCCPLQLGEVQQLCPHLPCSAQAKLPSSLAVCAAIASSSGHPQEDCSIVVPNTVGLLQPLSGSRGACAACLPACLLTRCHRLNLRGAITSQQGCPWEEVAIRHTSNPQPAS